MLEFLKKKVGRPSNETKRKRKIFYFSCVALVVALISVLTYTLTASNENEEKFVSFDVDKLVGNVANINDGTLEIKYIDNVKEDKASLNTTISIKEKLSYTGTNNIYYRLDLYQDNRLLSRGKCRAVNNEKIVTFSFKLTRNNLNVITGIYNDSNCSKTISKYRTKKYKIAKEETEDDEVILPQIVLPKTKDVWYIGDTSEILKVDVYPVNSTVNIESSNPEVMEVIRYENNSFRLSAKAKGTATIIATSQDGVSAKITYTVKEKNYIKIPNLPETWYVGNYKEIVVETSVTDKIKEFTSSNEKVMGVTKISENIYKLQATGKGTAVIKITTENGVSKEYKYTVKEKQSIAIPNYNSVLTVGKTYGKFSLKVTPSDSKVTLYSSNKDVIQVIQHDDNSSSGNSWSLNAKAKGTATITAKIVGTNVTKSYKYIVIEEAKDIKMPKYPDEWKVGDEYGGFSVTVSPSGSSVEVKSSDNSVVEVVKKDTNKWLLKAKAKGTATITASSSNGLETSYTYTVKEKTKISMKQLSGNLEIGTTSEKFSISVTPSNLQVTLYSSNTKVIQVMKYGNNSSSGNSWGLNAKAKGTATITAKASDGTSVSYTYTVKEKTTISMPKYQDELVAGQTYGKFSISVNPSDLNVTLYSSNTDVIQVIQHGNNSSSGNSWSLKAKAKGTATITAEASDGKVITYKYTVIEAPKLELPSLPTEWEEGAQSKEFSVTVVPSNATVNMTSSNPGVMEVIKNGTNKWVLKAKAKGTATITVTSSNDVSKHYTYTVKEKSKVSMPEYPSELEAGKTYGPFSLTTNTPGATVTLYSSDPNVIQVMNYNNNSWGLYAKAKGSAQITATSSKGANSVYNFKVTESTLITNGGSIRKEFEYNDFDFLIINNLSPSNAKVTVTSSNANVMDVETVIENKSYQLKAVGIGTVVITVSASNDKELKYTYTVKEPKYSLIEMTKFSDVLEVGTETNKFNVKLHNSKSTVTVTSSNKDVIQVIQHGDNSSSGNSWSLKAKAKGTATITASASNGAKQSYTYTVKEAEKTIDMTKFTGFEYWDSGSSGNITVSVVPASSTVTVTSSNPSVMSVKKISNTTWTLIAINAGTATITASATNGKSTSYTYKVRSNYPTPESMINSNYETKSADGVTVYFEKSCSKTSKDNIVNLIKKLPTYAKKSGQVVYVMTQSTWASHGHTGASGLTWTTSTPYIALPCDTNYSNDSYSSASLQHEYGHAVDYHYGAIKAIGSISSTKTYTELYNLSYRYVSARGCNKNSGKCEILRGYAYTATWEFFADSFMMTIRPILGYSNTASDISTNYGPIDKVTISPYGTIKSEVEKTLDEVKSVIK